MKIDDRSFEAEIPRITEANEEEEDDDKRKDLNFSSMRPNRQGTGQFGGIN